MSTLTSIRKPSLDQRLLREANTARPNLFGSLFANGFLSIVIVVQAKLLSQVISGVFLNRQTLSDVSGQLWLLLVVIALRGVTTYFGSRASAQLATQVKQNLRERLLAHLYRLGPIHHRNEQSGDLVLTATEGVEKLDGYYRDYLPGLFTALFLPFLMLLVVLPIDLLTFSVLLITAPLIPFFMALIGMAAGALAKRQFLGMRTLSTYFVDVMQGLTTLKLFNRSQYQVESIGRMTDQFRKATMRVLRVAFISALTLEMLATLSVAIVAVEIGVRLLNGGIGFQNALFLLVIAPEFYLPLRALGAKFHNATEGKAAAERVFSLLDTASSSTEQTSQLKTVPTHMHIRFEDVSLTYAENAASSLDHLSFEIKPGQFVALVGISGSGKTSLTNLLLRFLSPTSGRITINGHDLGAIPTEIWRENIAWVSQSPYLFNITLSENIRFGRPDATEAELIAAAQSAGAHDFILKLPDGYQTICGERGLRLSGGQAQRIALARALLRKAPLLILDEPTSSLDPDSESAVLRGLKEVASDRTILLITHRLSMAVSADQIIVLEKGKIVEQGTHTQLMTADGLYTQLFSKFRNNRHED